MSQGKITKDRSNIYKPWGVLTGENNEDFTYVKDEKTYYLSCGTPVEFEAPSEPYRFDVSPSTLKAIKVNGLLKEEKVRKLKGKENHNKHKSHGELHPHVQIFNQINKKLLRIVFEGSQNSSLFGVNLEDTEKWDKFVDKHTDAIAELCASDEVEACADILYKKYFELLIDKLSGKEEDFANGFLPPTID